MYNVLGLSSLLSNHKAQYLSEEQVPAVGGRVPSLDGLRAVSVMIVLCSHFISSKLFPGSLGVYIFFVISGFLITRLLFAENKKEGNISLPKFYARRAIRLYPVVLLYTAVVVIAYLASNVAIDWKQPIAVIFYFINYVYAPLGRDAAGLVMPFEPLWSLSVEEHFYFLFPAVMVILRKDPRSLFFAMLAVCGACLAYRLGWALARPDLLTSRFFYIRSECRLDSMAFGVGLACLCELPAGRAFLKRLSAPGFLFLGVVVTLATLVVRDDFFRETVRYTIQGLAIAVILAGVLFRPNLPAVVLNTRIFVFIGQISYSLYVWSICSREVVTHVMPSVGIAQTALAFLFAGLAACASYFLMERPLLNLRKRLGSMSQRRVAISPQANARVS